jgi:Ca-activated chloride channel family protein
MSFAYPFALGLLVIPALLVVAEVRNGGQGLVLPLDHGIAQPARQRRLVAALLLGMRLLPALSTAAAILVLAEPQIRKLPASRRAMTNVEICLDVSFSMTGPIEEAQSPQAAAVGHSRFDQAMEQVSEFILRRPGDSFGLTIFGKKVVRWAPLTFEPDFILRSKPFLNPKSLSREFTSRTDIAGALEASAATLLAQNARENLILIITDGEDNVKLTPALAQTLAATWSAARIKVCVIVVGHNSVPDRLQLIAEATGGMAATATDPDALPHAFRQIDALQRFTLEDVSPVDVPFADPFIIAGLILACSYLASLAGVRYTPW